MIQKCINEKNLDQAKTIASDAVKEEKAKEWRGNPQRWEEWLLTIAIKENDSVTIRINSKQFYFSRFDLKHYRIYKSTFSNEDWTIECNNWIKWFLDKGRITIRQLYALANIYIEEKYFDRLLVLLQKNPFYEFAQQCKPFLQEIYKEELLKIYRQSLLSFALDNTGRSNYKELRKRLNEVKKMPGGKPLVKELGCIFFKSE